MCGHFVLCDVGDYVVCWTLLLVVYFDHAGWLICFKLIPPYSEVQQHKPPLRRMDGISRLCSFVRFLGGGTRKHAPPPPWLAGLDAEV